jgi:hypothetical protein
MAPAPYYRVRLVGDRSSIALWYVPGEAKLTLLPFGYDTFAWTTVAGSWRETLDALARRIDPYPVSTIARATVDGRAVADPQSYLVLWSLTGKPHGYPRDYGVQIVLRSTQPSPWTDGNFLQFLPRDRMLVRDGELVAVPRWIAARIGRRASLAGIR